MEMAVALYFKSWRKLSLLGYCCPDLANIEGKIRHDIPMAHLGAIGVLVDYFSLNQS